MIETLKKQIEDSYYWDARVTALECSYFGDEVTLVFEDGQDNRVYHFEECYSVRIEHPVDCKKSTPSKQLKPSQIPYFMQNVEVRENVLGGEKYLEFTVSMHPLEVHVMCRKFNIS